MNRQMAMPNGQHFNALFGLKEDGSLRDRGIEIVSGILSPEVMGAGLHLIDEWNKFMKPIYSLRTGIHVHLNAKEFDVARFKTLSAVYTLFENSLFKISGNRQDSIFCVPIRIAQHGMPWLYNQIRGEDYFHEMLRHANKYMAFNCKPLGNFGTVEFRHMHGTDDMRELQLWFNVILSMYNYAETNPFNEVQQKMFALNTNSQYLMFGREVFGDVFNPFLLKVDEPFLIKDVEQGVGVLKEWHINTEKLIPLIKGSKKKPDDDWGGIKINPFQRPVKNPINKFGKPAVGLIIDDNVQWEIAPARPLDDRDAAAQLQDFIKAQKPKPEIPRDLDGVPMNEVRFDTLVWFDFSDINPPNLVDAVQQNIREHGHQFYSIVKRRYKPDLAAIETACRRLGILDQVRLPQRR